MSTTNFRANRVCRTPADRCSNQALSAGDLRAYKSAKDRYASTIKRCQFFLPRQTTW